MLYALVLQGIWVGMLFGTFVQTVVLIIITFKTDWDKQVIDLSLYDLSHAIFALGIQIVESHSAINFYSDQTFMIEEKKKQENCSN